MDIERNWRKMKKKGFLDGKFSTKCLFYLQWNVEARLLSLLFSVILTGQDNQNIVNHFYIRTNDVKIAKYFISAILDKKYDLDFIECTECLEKEYKQP